MLLKRFCLALSATFLLAVPAGAATRVLVLPFDTPSDSQTVTSLGPGTMDSLITALSRIPDFVLVDRTTLGHVLKEQALQQTGLVDDKTAVRLGKLLGVQAIIHGRVQVAGERVRLSASFIEAETGRVRRAEQVTGHLDDVFDLQDQLAHRFVTDQGVIVSPQADRQMATAIRSTHNLKAYEAYQQGQAWYQFATAPGYENSLAWYDQALQTDPNYALAWAGKADSIAALVWMHTGYYHTTAVTYEQGIEAARKALALQPDLPQAHRAMALMLCTKEDYKPAQMHARRFLELMPNNPDACMAAWMAENSRDPEDPLMLRALELNPRMILAHLQRVVAFAKKGKVKEAFASAEIAMSLNPDADTTHFIMGMLQYMTGHPIRSVQYYRKAVELNPKHAAAYNYLGDALRSLSRYDEAMTAYRQATRLRPDYYDARESLLKLERQER
jgi:tetratricopeptide (TPR) repeat protein